MVNVRNQSSGEGLQWTINRADEGAAVRLLSLVYDTRLKVNRSVEIMGRGATLRALDIIFRSLQKLQNNIFNILAHIACFGQRGCIRHCKGHV